MLRNVSAFTWLLLAVTCLVAAAAPQDSSNWVPVGHSEAPDRLSGQAGGTDFQIAQSGSSSLAERLKAIRGSASQDESSAPSSRDEAPPATAAGSRVGNGLPSVLVHRGSSPPSETGAPVRSMDDSVVGPTTTVPANEQESDESSAESLRRTARRPTREAETHRAPVTSTGIANNPAGAAGSGMVANQFSLSKQGPLVTVEAEGPRAIVMGKEATYRVRVINQGSAEADRVIVTVGVPAWAQVTKTLARVGSVTATSDRAGAAPIVWDMERVPPRSQHELTIAFQPSENRPIELAVDWVFRASSMQTTIDVQQPQLAVAVDGPTEMRFGGTAVFKIKLSNPGNGPAEGITVNVAAGGAANPSNTIGALAAGESRTLEVELTAKQAGTMQIQAAAQADGNLRAEAAHEVRVRRAQLAVKVTAPSLLYAGATARYEIRVANTGDAPAEGVTLEVELPQGIKNAVGVDKKPIETDAPRWRLGDLPPGSDRVYKMQGDLTTGGAQRFAARVASADENTASDAVQTQVEAIADLKLVVNDPQGPLPVGHDVTYEILVLNRGSKEAQNVNLVAQFSEGIEPTAAAGHGGEIMPGQVIFEPIRVVPAGGQVAVQVTAKPLKSGNMRFRAELSCDELETKLVSELTTRFYGSAGDQTVPSDRPAAADRTGSEPTPARR